MVWVHSSRVSEVPGVPTRGKARLERKGRRERGDLDTIRQESPSSDLDSGASSFRSQELSDITSITSHNPEMHSWCLAVLLDERDRGTAFV